MLEYTINNTVYKFNAGFAFIRAIQPVKKDAAGGDQGLMWTMAGVMDRDPERLRDALLAMNTGQEPRITQDDLEAWLEQHEDLEKVFVEVSDFFGRANCTTSTWSRLQAVVTLANAAKKG